METITLNNNVVMPALGLGVYQSSPTETVEAVSEALRMGYRLIDTASAYQNEVQVGEGIRKSGINRDEVFVTTKLWTTDYQNATAAFEESLRRLDLDYVDLYLLHWPRPHQFDDTIAAYRAVEKLAESGKARAIGMCNSNPSDLEKLAEHTGIVPAVNQVELHPYFRNLDVQNYNTEHGIVTQAWSPIGGVNVYSSTGGNPLTDPTVARIAETHGKTPAQIILRWHLQEGRSAIPKSVHANRIAENFDVFDFVLSAEELVDIDALDTGRRGGPDPASF